jgi:Arc/MetJ-type ribon-helix-helix transcriptional regulator
MVYFTIIEYSQLQRVWEVPFMAGRPVRKVTYSLPEELVEQIRDAVRDGAAPSYSAFVQEALEEGVRQARERRLAEAFRDAGSDPAFLEDVEGAMRDFRDSDQDPERTR